MKNRRLTVTAAALLSTAGLAQAQFTESFDVINGTIGTPSSPTGWTAQNNSGTIGTTSWFQGNTAVFAQFSGAGYLGGNFNSTTGLNTISLWQISPVTSLTNGAQLTFYTRTVDAPFFPDRLQVRMNKANTGTNVGVGPTDVGDFTDLLLDINPSYLTTGTGSYPNTWTQFTATVSNVTGTVSGRLAFRYFVENAGPSGANSDYIGIDDAVYSLVGLPTGRCCFTDGSCQVLTSPGCGNAGGTYGGDGSSCTPNTCPQPATGRCCAFDGTCTVVTAAQCATANGVYGGDGTTCGTCPVPASETGDAGDLPGTAQVVSGSGPLPGIMGTLALDDADMYRINVCDAANFSATTRFLTTLDTQLAIYRTTGVGVVFNDDTAPGGLGLQSTIGNGIMGGAGNGEYYLAISEFDKDGLAGGLEIWLDTPYGAERAPDGPGAANPVDSWSSDAFTEGGAYGIRLTGTCYIGGGGGCYANCDASTGTPALTGNDFVCFINKYNNGDTYANCDGSAGNPLLTGNDFVCFINKYNVGCP